MPITSPEFSVSTGQVGEWVVVTAAGELDMATSPQVEAAVSEVLPGSPRVVIDLSEVTFMDSSALRMLTQAHRALSGSGGQLRVVVATPQVRKVLQLTGLLGVFSIHGTLTEATT
jgi:anti-sigma B factor antagonist